jgi:hypothetical protein
VRALKIAAKRKIFRPASEAEYLLLDLIRSRIAVPSGPENASVRVFGERMPPDHRPSRLLKKTVCRPNSSLSRLWFSGFIASLQVIPVPGGEEAVRREYLGPVRRQTG